MVIKLNKVLIYKISKVKISIRIHLIKFFRSHNKSMYNTLLCTDLTHLTRFERQSLRLKMTQHHPSHKYAEVHGWQLDMMLRKRKKEI